MRFLNLNRFPFLFNVLQKPGVVAGSCVWALFLIGMLLFDGLIFYTNVTRPREAATGSERKTSLSEKEIADTLKLLDDREREFNDILTGLGGTGNIASSTKVR